MAGNSYTSMLSLLQMMLKQQEAEREHQRKLDMMQREQSSGQDQQSSPMDAYNQYTQVMDMMPVAAPAASSSGVPTTGAELTAMSGGSSGLGTGAGSTAGGTAGGAGGMATAAAPYAALAAALGAFKLNDDWMSKGSGKTFGGEMQDAWSESFGNNGIWGALKGLFH